MAGTPAVVRASGGDANLGGRAVAVGPTPAPVAAAAPNGSFVAERLSSPAALLDLAEQLGNDATALAFQRRAWLAPWYASLAADPASTPCPIAVRDDVGRIAALLAEHRSALIFVQRPMSLALVIVVLAVLLLPRLVKLWQRSRQRDEVLAH